MISIKRSKNRGLTLVELMVAIALTTVIVGVAAFASIQVQRTISLANAREDAARSARAFFTDLDDDLARLVVGTKAPPPFDKLPTQYAQKALTLTLGGSASAATRDNAADTIRMLTTIHSPEGGEGMVRALVEYSIDTPRPQPGGGPLISRALRKILYWAKTDPSKPASDPSRVTLEAALPNGQTASFPIADGITSMQIEWCPQGLNAFRDPDPTTATGVAFAYEGTLNLALPGLSPAAGEANPSPNLAFTLTGADPAGTSLVQALPVGGEVRISIPNTTASSAYVVRRKLSDRVFVNDRVDMLRPAAGPYTATATAFIPPALTRVTLVFTIGKGPEAQMTRYTRTFTVSQ